jgi:hypothetical protein
MNMSASHTSGDAHEDTLDPPGTIAILGGGPLGLEAALYGRYLGYDVQLFEAGQICQNLRGDSHAPAPPHCTTALGLAALAAQKGLGGTRAELEIKSQGEWITDYFERLAQCDLLADRVHTWSEVLEVTDAPLLNDEDEDDSEDETLDDDSPEVPLPPDFLVHYKTLAGERREARFEAIIDARGPNARPSLVHQWPLPRSYYFPLGRLADPHTDFLKGLEQLRCIFAQLWGRANLDVYQNLGG